MRIFISTNHSCVEVLTQLLTSAPHGPGETSFSLPSLLSTLKWEAETVGTQKKNSWLINEIHISEFKGRRFGLSCPVIGTQFCVLLSLGNIEKTVSKDGSKLAEYLLIYHRPYFRGQVFVCVFQVVPEHFGKPTLVA